MPGKCSTVNVNQVVANNEIRFFPKPANTELNILSGEAISTIQIYDITGKTIYSNPAVNAETMRVDVTSFRPGVIVVKLIDKKGNSMSEKIIVK